ncbi:MAG: tRNA (adenosine(37)-N6)-threonylcarbamoyltransferase complex dimerization subunit type 1 TsaB [Candidatus Omnitrophica bacterium]|nr:tRNA (adenosine(37)-N6)-threonylcarbamoyltransferase complex dimerization subunit type 1 TsaB [Candidatus Omnitrophota bacterium]
MYFLSFETSSKIFSLALSRDEKVLRFRNIKNSLVLEDSILPAMDKILASASLKFSQMDGFAVALGPGSFTSLRVGLSVIKAFAFGTGKPVVGIPTLDILAEGVRNKGDVDEICVLNDARRGNVFASFYRPVSNQGLERKSDYLLTTLDKVLEKVHGQTLFVGDALGLYRETIEKAYQSYNVKKKCVCKCLFVNEKLCYPQSKVMAGLAFERFQNKQYEDPGKLLPLYLYPQDCQVAKKA